MVDRPEVTEQKQQVQVAPQTVQKTDSGYYDPVTGDVIPTEQYEAGLEVSSKRIK